MSKVITVDAGGTVATVRDATAGDIVSTLFNTDEVLTGAYGYAQKAGLAAIGFMISNRQHTGNFFDFSGHTGGEEF